MRSIQSAWSWITEPVPAISGEEQRSRYRLLAGALFVLIIATIGILISVASRNPIEEWLYDADTAAAVIAIGLGTAMYAALRRTQRITLIASLNIIVIFFVTTFPPFFPGSRNTTLYFMIFIPLYVGMFFPVRQLLLWLLIFPVVLTLVPPLLQAAGVEVALDGRFVRNTLEFLIVITVIIAVFVTHLTYVSKVKNESLEQANAALRQSEALLEQRVADRTRDLDEARQQTEKFYRISTAMNNADSYTDIIDIVAREVAEQNFTIALTLYDLPESAGAMGRLIAAKPPHQPVIAVDMALPVGQLPTPEAPILVIPDMHNAPYPELSGLYLQMNILAVASANIVVNGRVLASLSYTNGQPVQFKQTELDILRIGAQVAAAAIERRQRFDEQVAIAEKLRTVDTMKSQFLASMSHELRTPLNAILNFTEFVSMGMMGPVNERQHDALEKALESGRHLLSLINDVLDITKIEADMMQLFVEENIDLHAEMATVRAAAQPLLRDKPIDYIEDIDPNLPPVVGDRRRIRQVLLNLMSNAAKFTEEGTITVSVKRRDEMLLFGVIDTGPGISAEDQQIIFEPFVQTASGIKHAGGTGLGLPISNRLVQAHGGRLWVESTGGEGAAFFFTLPIASPILMQKLQVA